METVQKRVAALLKQKISGLAGTIYIPTHPQSSSQNVAADRTRFKNALQQIHRLEKFDHAKLAGALKQLDELYEDMEFWKYQDQGLAVLFSGDDMEYFKLPFEVTEAQYLTDHFVVSPILVMDAIDTTFYVLDINFTAPRLFRGTRGQLVEVNKENMPGSLDDEVGKDEYKKELQHRSSGVCAYHGHGEDDTVNEEERRYLKIVADMADLYLGEGHAPLLLAGTDSRTKSIRKELGYKFVMSRSFDGNVEHYTGSELYKKVSDLVKAHLQSVRQSAVSRLEETDPKLVAAGSEKILTITKAEASGRVETLYLPIYRLTKDTVQPGDNTAFIIELPENIAPFESLVTAVANQGGEVLPVELEAHALLDVPKALCRY